MRELQYKIPDGIMYPVVAAFRSLVAYNSQTDTYEWADGSKPSEVWNKCGTELASKVMNFASSIGDNPNAVGKDQNVWDLAYMTVLLNKK